MKKAVCLIFTVVMLLQAIPIISYANEAVYPQTAEMGFMCAFGIFEEGEDAQKPLTGDMLAEAILNYSSGGRVEAKDDDFYSLAAKSGLIDTQAVTASGSVSFTEAAKAVLNALGYDKIADNDSEYDSFSPKDN